MNYTCRPQPCTFLTLQLQAVHHFRTKGVLRSTQSLHDDLAINLWCQHLRIRTPCLSADPKDVVVLQWRADGVADANHIWTFWRILQQSCILHPVSFHTLLFPMPPVSIIFHKQRGILILQHAIGRQIGLQVVSTPSFGRRKTSKQLRNGHLRHQQLRQRRQQLRFSHAADAVPWPAALPPWRCATQAACGTPG